MRTTLTLEDDVAAMLQKLKKERGLGLKEAVNLALRQGLLAIQKDASARPEFKITVFDTGSPLLSDVDSVSETLSLIEGEDYR